MYRYISAYRCYIGYMCHILMGNYYIISKLYELQYVTLYTN